jgi:hypothetical protein
MVAESADAVDGNIPAATAAAIAIAVCAARIRTCFIVAFLVG